MAGSMNGALLALGVVGAVALAGRVRRGSFAHGWHGRARELLNAARDEQYVDSGDLIEVLEAIRDDHSVTGRTRARVVSLLLGSQDEGYLDSDEAMEVIKVALGHGSRAVYGMSRSDAAATLRRSQSTPLDRSHAGEALNDYQWHPQRALAQLAASSKKRKGKGSRARKGGAKQTKYVAVVAGKPVALPMNVSHDYDLARKYARRTYGTDHVELGRHSGSRARKLLDNPGYTHYVVHTPSMKIASGWHYAEDAKEALADMGGAKSHCKVYTRKYLRDNGRDPRHNGNWSARGQF